MERERLPDERQSLTRKLKLMRSPKTKACPSCGHCWEEPGAEMRVYVTTSVYPDGRPGELFLKADKVGSLASGVLDAVGIAISVGLQSGVPLRAYTSKLLGMRFEPSGFTKDKDFPSCTSVLDFVARYLDKLFPEKP